jgi:hypothetical protein
MDWRRLLVAGKAVVPRARLHEDFTHSRAPDIGIIEGLAAQPVGDRLYMSRPS